MGQVVSPFAKDTKVHLLEQCEEFAQRIAVPGNVILREGKKRQQSKRDRENLDDLRFQVYHNFSANGYDSPGEMLRDNPEWARALRLGRFEHEEEEEEQHVGGDSKAVKIAR